jgi:hypothetical protein
MDAEQLTSIGPYQSTDQRVEGPNPGTFSIDTHTIDHVRVRDPETGLWSERSVKASDDEIRQREIDGLTRGLASVDHRLATLDPNDVMPYEEPLSEGAVEKRRAGLEAEREYVLARLAEYEPAPAPTKGRRR